MISAILLAAGQSKRMIDENKLTKEFKNIPLIKHSVNNILSSNIDELIIVLGYQKTIVQNILDENSKIKFVTNENFSDGMSTSIKSGLKYLSDNSEAFFICLGDMPFINKKIYNHLINSRIDNHIVVPTYKNKQANPVLFPKVMQTSIMSISGDSGAKKILEENKNNILNIKIDDIGITKDFNTKDDFNSSFNKKN